MFAQVPAGLYRCAMGMAVVLCFLSSQIEKRSSPHLPDEATGSDALEAVCGEGSQATWVPGCGYTMTKMSGPGDVHSASCGHRTEETAVVHGNQ